MPEPLTPFHDLGEYVAIPRLTGLVLSPDGGRLVASMQQLAAGGDRSAARRFVPTPRRCRNGSFEYKLASAHIATATVSPASSCAACSLWLPGRPASR